MFASVIIPTYNRKASLLRTLESLKRQTYPIDCYEIIIVDDESTDGTDCLTYDDFPFQIRYFRQKNAGATHARNAGASKSLADVLVFLDDDIVATPDTLENLVCELSGSEPVIVLGSLIPAFDGPENLFGALYGSGAIFPGDIYSNLPSVNQDSRIDHTGCFIHFTNCLTGALSIRRQDFLAINMFQDPTGGWPNWDDVDFGYRAHLQGFRFWRSYQAIIYHYDYSLESLEANCRRWERASRSVVQFFKRYPELFQHFPSYYDKGPIAFSTDSLGLITRKTLRSLISNPSSLFLMRRLTHIFEKNSPDSSWLIFLYRWIISAHMYKGYRQGLHELTRDSLI